MGMSTHIKAYIPDTDPEYQKHKKILLACADANASLPKETMKYFNTKIDDADGIRNEQELKLVGKLWFLPDGSMYVYYTPTHWWDHINK